MVSVLFMFRWFLFWFIFTSSFHLFRLFVVVFSSKMALELEFYSLCSIRIFLLPFSIAFSPFTHFRPHITYAPFQILLRLIIIYFRFLIICYRLWAKNEMKKKQHILYTPRKRLFNKSKKNITKIKSTSYNADEFKEEKK